MVFPMIDMKLLKDGAGKLAAKLVQESKGAKNKTKPAEKNKLKAVEVVDPETGGTQIDLTPI
jgi:hypothetical protein